MIARITAIILHPGLRRLLLSAAAFAALAEGQEAAEQVKVTVEVTDGQNSMRAAMIPPAREPAGESAEAPAAPTPAPPALAEPEVTQEPEAEPPGRSEAAAKHLALGRELLLEGKYLTIPGRRGSALNAFRMALSIDPANAEAQSGIQSILDLLVAKAEAARVSGNMKRARSLLDSAEGVVEPFVDRAAIAPLRASIGKAQSATSATADTEPPAKTEAPAAGVVEAKVEPQEPKADTRAAEMGSAPGDVPAVAAPAVLDLDLAPLYHVGRRLHAVAPGDNPCRWTLNDRPISDEAQLDYVFQESDQGICLVRGYRERGGESVPVLVAEGVTEVKLFEDNVQTYELGDTVVLDPTRHGPVEGTYSSYEWRVDGKTVSTEPTLTCRLDSVGMHRVECRMEGPTAEVDQHWPSPWLAWRLKVVEPRIPELAAAVQPPGSLGGTGAPPGGNSGPILVILGAAVTLLAFSQAWMAYRLSVLSRDLTPGPEPGNQLVALPHASITEEPEDLRERFHSHETIQY